MSRPLRSLYVCYLSLEDPLVHTQVLAYLEGLAERGHVIHLLTFEPKLTRRERRARREELARRRITWHALRYHKRPSLPATVYDALVGAVLVSWLLRRYRLDAVHARNHVPAATALIARRLNGCRLIFDIRGLMAEEYVDAGRWRRGGLAYRITQWIERAAIERADGLVVLTDAVRRQLFLRGDPPRLHVIPCCADTERLDAAGADREVTRAELGIGDRPVLVYVGKFTGWYLEREMVDLFVAARKEVPDLLFLVISQSDHELITAEFARRGVAAADWRVLGTPAQEVARHLAAADIGVSLIRPCFSKISSSPTKIGEYLGAGLPVISTAGIGDVDELLSPGVGVLVRELADDSYRRAAADARRLLDDGATPERCRSTARQYLSLADVGIPRYDRLYRSVAGVNSAPSGTRRRSARH